VIVSRRRLEERNARQAAHIDRLIAERDSFKEDAKATGSALEQQSGELSRMKDVVALHLVAAGHPSTVVHDVRTFAEALREALAASRVDICLELARLEGADL
jgi:hypothetical protein